MTLSSFQSILTILEKEKKKKKKKRLSLCTENQETNKQKKSTPPPIQIRQTNPKERAGEGNILRSNGCGKTRRMPFSGQFRSAAGSGGDPASRPATVQQSRAGEAPPEPRLSPRASPGSHTMVGKDRGRETDARRAPKRGRGRNRHRPPSDESPQRGRRTPHEPLRPESAPAPRRSIPPRYGPGARSGREGGGSPAQPGPVRLGPARPAGLLPPLRRRRCAFAPCPIKAPSVIEIWVRFLPGGGRWREAGIGGAVRSGHPPPWRNVSLFGREGPVPPQAGAPPATPSRVSETPPRLWPRPRGGAEGCGHPRPGAWGAPARRERGCRRPAPGAASGRGRLWIRRRGGWGGTDGSIRAPLAPEMPRLWPPVPNYFTSGKRVAPLCHFG